MLCVGSMRQRYENQISFNGVTSRGLSGVFLMCRWFGFFWQLLGEEGFGEIADINGALAEGALRVALCPKHEGDLGVVYARVVADAEADVRAASVAVAAYQADGRSCFHGLAGFDE